jgi:hypothetical protein
LGEIVNVIYKAQIVLDASKDVGVEVNPEKTKYIFMSRHQTAGQNICITVADKSLKI